jgi:hypothetical protein
MGGGKGFPGMLPRIPGMKMPKAPRR